MFASGGFTLKCHLDFETYSELDITKVGAMRYSEHPSTEALIASYAIGDGPVVGVDLTKKGWQQKMQPFFQAVQQGATVAAHNSQFERTIWENVCKHWPVRPKHMQWDCTSARAGALSLPRSLESVGVALGLNNIKDPLGRGLIKKFSGPQKGGTRIMPEDDPVAFSKFIDYCMQDTIVERDLDNILPELNETERKVFALDYKINKIGVPIDIPLIDTALEFIDEVTRKLNKRAMKLTGVKPSQRDRLLDWLEDQGEPLESLQAAAVEKALLDPSLPPQVREILESRIEISRAGTKKLVTMKDCVSPDGRVRGAFWYWSASTGRWGSQRVQFHNLAKPDLLYPQEEIITLLKQKVLDLLYARPLTAIAKSIRGFVKAEEGNEFAVADYSAIEARGLAWLANETWLLKAYLEGKDVYKLMAADIFKVRYQDVTDAQRFFGKQTILGAGYGMGVPKFMATCARFGVITDEQTATKAINGYRDSVPAIAGRKDSNGYRKGGLWSDVEKAAIRGVLSGKPQVICDGKLVFLTDTLPNGFQVLYIQLPSGRRLCYPQPRIEQIEKWGYKRPTLVFKTLHRYMWVDEETYGGKLTENIIQALTRDLLADGLLTVDRAGLSIVGHVHDEVIAEVPQGSVNVSDFEELVCKTRKWSQTIPVAAEGKTVFRYAK